MTENVKLEDLHVSVFTRDFHLSTASLDKACTWIDPITCQNGENRFSPYKGVNKTVSTNHRINGIIKRQATEEQKII